MAAAPTFLSIAGSDPSGGAGLQADLRTAAAHGLFGCGVVTAVTVQNRRGVLRSEPVDADLVAAQLAAILEDGSLAAIKTGMLATAAIVRVVGDLLATTQAPLVVDPVFTSSSGAVLLEGDLVSLYREHLFGHATLVTPNYDEAAAFLGCAPEDVAQAPEHAAAELGRDVPTLLTGGHASGRPVDILAWRGRVQTFEGPRIDALSSHGTGCLLSSSIAAALALGLDLPAAVGHGKACIAEGLRGAHRFGVHLRRAPPL